MSSNDDRSPQKSSTRGTSRKIGVNPITINTTQEQNLRDTQYPESQYPEEDGFSQEDDPDPYTLRSPSSSIRLNKPAPPPRRSSRDIRDTYDGREMRSPRDTREIRTTRDVQTENRRSADSMPTRRTYKQEPGFPVAPVAPRPARNMTTSYEVPKAPTGQKHRNVHWLIYVGMGMLAALALWTLGAAALNWGTNEYNNVVYGYPRTYQIDAVVGHNDSPQNPSHFIAVNLRGQILIFELPGGNPSKSIDYIGPELAGTNVDQLPVTLSFAHYNNDKRLDMIVHIPGRNYIFCNNGTKFSACSQSST